MSLSFNIDPTWASIILTGLLLGFSILWTASNGINIWSFCFLEKLSLLSVILGVPSVTNQCSDLWWCFCKLKIPLGFTNNSLIKKPLPSNKLTYLPQGL